MAGGDGPAATTTGRPAYDATDHQYLPLRGVPVLVVYPSRRPSRGCRIGILVLALLLAGIALWPRDIYIRAEDVRILAMNWNGDERGVGLDVKLGLQLRVWNPNLYGVRYDRIMVDLGYRGDKLGTISLLGGRVPALRVVDAAATMDVEGAEVLAKAPILLLDILSGDLPLVTTIDFSGDLDLFMFDAPIQVRLGCDIDVDPQHRKILRRQCEIRQPDPHPLRWPTRS